MSTAPLVGQSPEVAQMALLLSAQEQQQSADAVTAQVEQETGGGAAPMVSSAVTAPGALELFA